MSLAEARSTQSRVDAHYECRDAASSRPGSWASRVHKPVLVSCSISWLEFHRSFARLLTLASFAYFARVFRAPSSAPLSEGGVGDELLRVEIGIAERQVNRGQTFEVVADDHLIGHAHAAV
jgi:hypothetical protein